MWELGWRGRCAAPLIVLAVVGLTGCAGARAPDGVPSATVSTTSGVRVPADGMTLSDIGLVNGPVNAFSVPRRSGIAVEVDQPNGVSLVFTKPSATEIADYLRRALPHGGFVITRDDRASSTLTFTGSGWTGAFTGSEDSSAVILRPSHKGG